MIKIEVLKHRATLDIQTDTNTEIVDDVFTVLRVLYNIFEERNETELFYQMITFFMNNVKDFELTPANTKLAAIIDEILKANGEK
ncbi:MAG: hypothetical protein IKU15_00170 [Clostridia bacterium]|nr:hypothetical protein [Clostridia bacterium]